MQQRAVKTRARILEAASERFAEKGFNGATVDEIAGLAGVNKQRLYAYFGSKNGLFEAVLCEVFEQVELFSRATVEKARKKPEKLTAILIQGFLHVHAAHPRFWRLLAWANLEGDGSTAALKSARKKENDELRLIFEKASADGLLADIRFETYLFTLLAATYFRYSNALTLTQTLGLKADAQFEKTLINELDKVFQRGKTSE